MKTIDTSYWMDRGSKACAEGKILYCSVDPEINALIASSNTVGDKRTIAAMKAWNSGWVRESLKRED